MNSQTWAVQVLEADAVHEAVVDRRLPWLASRGNSLVEHVVAFGTASAESAVITSVPFAVSLISPTMKLRNFGLGQKHGEDIVVDDHAGGGLVGKLLVECKAQSGEEGPEAFRSLTGRLTKIMRMGCSLLKMVSLR